MSIHSGTLCSRGRVIAAATVAALALATVAPPAAIAGPMAPPSKDAVALAAAPDAAGVIQVRHRRYYRGGNAAGLAMMGMMFGTIGAIAAQERRREYYDRYYYGGYAPYYYGNYYGTPYPNYYNQGYYPGW
jgi:hypothetical protein